MSLDLVFIFSPNFYSYFEKFLTVIEYKYQPPR